MFPFIQFVTIWTFTRLNLTKTCEILCSFYAYLRLWEVNCLARNHTDQVTKCILKNSTNSDSSLWILLLSSEITTNQIITQSWSLSYSASFAALESKKLKIRLEKQSRSWNVPQTLSYWRHILSASRSAQLVSRTSLPTKTVPEKISISIKAGSLCSN